MDQKSTDKLFTGERGGAKEMDCPVNGGSDECHDGREPPAWGSRGGGKSIGNPVLERAEVWAASYSPRTKDALLAKVLPGPILLHCCTASDVKSRLSEKN